MEKSVKESTEAALREQPWRKHTATFTREFLWTGQKIGRVALFGNQGEDTLPPFSELSNMRPQLHPEHASSASDRSHSGGPAVKLE